MSADPYLISGPVGYGPPEADPQEASKFANALLAYLYELNDEFLRHHISPRLPIRRACYLGYREKSLLFAAIGVDLHLTARMEMNPSRQPCFANFVLHFTEDESHLGAYVSAQPVLALTRALETVKKGEG